MIKNVAADLRFFVQDTATGLGVAGLTTGSFTTIKLLSDGVLGSDIKGTISLVDGGAGFYSFLATNAQMNANVIQVIAAPSTATYQAFSGVVRTEQAVLAGLATATALVTVGANVTTIDGIVDAIKLKTDNLPSDPADESAVEAAITAATSPLATSAALATAQTYLVTLDANLDTVIANGVIASSLATQAKADVNAEMVDVINTDATAEISSMPGATASLRSIIATWWAAFRNAGTTTSTARTIKNDAGTTVSTATLADDGSTFTKGEFS
jgi:hypothetical protein